MTFFERLPAPEPLCCAWCAYQRGDSTEALLRPWLAQWLGYAPEDVPGIGRDAHGRPYLVGDCDPELDVNWSHSGERLMVALGRGVRLGVDLEFQRPRRNALALAERFFAPCEAGQLRTLPDSTRESAFTRLWCAKEAVLKAHGQGISYGLDRLVFALEGDAWRLIRCEGELAPARDWTVHAFTPRPSYLAALAWRQA